MSSVPGLVEQIQSVALDPSVPVATLLRKVKVAATKLGLDDALTWVDRELHGYRLQSDTPPYRKGRGHTVAWNPYHGWQPVHFGNHKTADLVAELSFGEPIGAYEELLKDCGSSLKLNLSNELVAALNETFSFQTPRVANEFGRGAIVAIVQRVRDMVLDWSLELARAGITGQGLSFTSAERERASVAQISIGEFHGSFNTGHAVSGGQITQSTTVKTSADLELFERIIKTINSSDLASNDKVQALQVTEELKRADDKESYLASYQRFVTMAADHVTVLGPFIPALSSMLS